MNDPLPMPQSRATALADALFPPPAGYRLLGVIAALVGATGLGVAIGAYLALRIVAGACRLPGGS